MRANWICLFYFFIVGCSSNSSQENIFDQKDETNINNEFINTVLFDEIYNYYCLK